ncbi:MAG: pantoate--beta-alanine ligase [Proteobacteria bacterium]|nr:pantoate--beta-alanine ligase [Pseudomonadota bacterium]
MKIIQSPAEMQLQAHTWKKEGMQIALVPTMGCLHAGHLSLMRKAAENADRIIASIFVNPIQFGPHEDFDAYPRQFQADCDLAEKEGVHVIFCPDTKGMYPHGFQTTVSVGTLSQGMCGANRPGHFDGVATVVSKLLHLTSPDVAIFGEKDFQQLAIIRQMVRDLNFPATIVGAPIVREEDGLAMSSRNKYLQGEMRTQALCLYRSIQSAQKKVAHEQQVVAADTIIEATKKTVAEAGGKLEYAVVINEHSLQAETLVGSSSVLAIAVKIGGVVRLIDNSKLFTTMK